MEFVRDYWWLIGLAVILVLAFLLFRPRQRVTLTDSSPTRPHMTRTRPPEGRGLAGEAAAGVSDVTGELLGAPVHDKLDGVSAPHDDLGKLKGVGPKFANALQAIGFYRFEQIASLSETEVERIDEQLGAFRGRLTRDRIVEQAKYLARDDLDGFEQRFGKL